MNRQTKRMMARQGTDKPKAPDRRVAAPAPTKRERTGPRQYLNEVRAEMRKVAWPTRHEVVNSTIIVLIAVVVMTALIFGFDYVSGKFVLWLFG
jgi:preprotein translocase subunit SecE